MIELPQPLWLGIGLLAQAMFSARFLVQWLLSERARRSLLPVHFWAFSVIGAVLLLAYAAHQRDLVIMLGQLVGLAIYLRNIELLRRAARQRGGDHHGLPPAAARLADSFLPPWLLLAASALLAGLTSQEVPLLQAASERAEAGWFLLGLLGQTLFTGRFVVQLILSERARASINPVQFWYLSISGSALLLAYALHTGDLVIILGQSFGMLVYLRNLALIRRQRPADHHGEPATLASLRCEADEIGDRINPRIS